jgi:hypothetical protein
MKCQAKGCRKKATRILTLLLKKDLFLCADHAFLIPYELKKKGLIHLPYAELKIED